MAAWIVPQRLYALTLLVTLAACGSGEIGQTVFNIEGFCAGSPLLAIVVEIDTDGAPITSVTATREHEQHCFLERMAGERDGEDAGEAEAALYSCLFQGLGTYTVRVKSGKQTWTQEVEVAGDECHISELQTVRFEL